MPFRILPVRLRMCAVCLLATCEFYAAEPDRAVLPVMRSAASDIDDIRIVKRVPVDAELDLIVALGASKFWGTSQGNSTFWGDHRILGILLQRRTRPSLIYKIAIRKGEGDCEVRLERATAKDVVLSCTPEKGGPGPNYKFVYDIRSKTLVKEIAYKPFSLRRIFPSPHDAVLVGSDIDKLVAVKYDPTEELAFRLLKGVQAAEWKKRVETSVYTSLSGAEEKHSMPRRFTPIRFGPANRFTFAQEVTGRTNQKETHFVVLEQNGRVVKRYSLPQSSYKEFARARPGRVKDGYVRQGTTIDEAIRAWQIVDGTLWFAKGFYDGEGVTGVGGFGYFDTEQRKYHIYAPHDLVNWSITAILVQREAVWLALAKHGEWGSSGGGLLRFDRATQDVERIELREIVNAIASVGDHLLLATDFGAGVVKNNTVRRFFVDETTGGRLQVSEAVLGNLNLPSLINQH